MKVLSVHYPEYFPSIDFFRKLLLSDVFIITDNLKFSKRTLINRARIKKREGMKWITVPVLQKGKGSQAIHEVIIDPFSNWYKKHTKHLSVSYKNTFYYDKYFPEISNILSYKWEKLIDLNLKIINYIVDDLQIKKNIMLGSELGLAKKGGNVIPEILNKTGCHSYIIEEKYESYLKKISFNKEITIVYKDFKPVVYRQLFGDFIPCLSIIDLLFNHGKESKDIILGTK